MLDPNNDRQTDFSNMFKEGRMGRGLVRGKGPKARPGGLALEEGAPGRPPPRTPPWEGSSLQSRTLRTTLATVCFHAKID